MGIREPAEAVMEDDREGDVVERGVARSASLEVIP